MMALASNKQCSMDLETVTKKPGDSVSERLELLFLTSKWSDCTFLVGGRDDLQAFQAHKLILASSSPVFEAMCYGTLAEQYSIKVPDIEPNAFRIMLQYIYTDELALSCVEEACETLYAAKKYMLSKLSQLCRQYILCFVSATNVIAVYEFAEELNEIELIEPCMQQISRYANHIFATQNEHMKPSTLSTILTQNDLNISELKLFEGIVRWTEVECQLRNLVQTGDNLRSILVECGALCNIRFLALSDEEFITCLSRSEILTSQEKNGIWDSIMLRKNQLKEYTEPSLTEEDQSMFVKQSEVPDGICRIIDRRQQLPLRLLYCIRSFLKTSRVISGSPKYLTKVAVSKSIFIHGIRFFSRLMPLICSRDNLQLIECTDNMYQEVMQISIYKDQNILLSQTVFRKVVEYSTKIIAFLETPVILFPEHVYSVTFKSLASGRMEYPTAFLGDEEKHKGIVFNFWDCTTNNGCLVNEGKDMGFLDSIVFSPA